MGEVHHGGVVLQVAGVVREVGDGGAVGGVAGGRGLVGHRAGVDVLLGDGVGAGEGGGVLLAGREGDGAAGHGHLGVGDGDVGEGHVAGVLHPEGVGDRLAGVGVAVPVGVVEGPLLDQGDPRVLGRRHLGLGRGGVGLVGVHGGGVPDGPGVDVLLGDGVGVGPGPGLAHVQLAVAVVIPAGGAHIGHQGVGKRHPGQRHVAGVGHRHGVGDGLTGGRDAFLVGGLGDLEIGAVDRDVHGSGGIVGVASVTLTPIIVMIIIIAPIGAPTSPTIPTASALITAAATVGVRDRVGKGILSTEVRGRRVGERAVRGHCHGAPLRGGGVIIYYREAIANVVFQHPGCFHGQGGVFASGIVIVRRFRTGVM